MVLTREDLTALDDQLSQRFIKLDPAGYFLIYLDREEGVICAEHYTNDIDEKGLAIDPETGEPFPCDKSLKRKPTAIYKGKTAKSLGIEITEKADPPPLTYLDHALYLGRELMKAEAALLSGEDYVQD